MSYIGYCDGACVPNPGRMAIGMVLCDPEGEIIYQKGKRFFEGTNNRAEYLAIIHTMLAAHGHAVKHLVIYTDSKLAYNQVNGNYKVKHPKIIPLVTHIHGFEGLFDAFELRHATGTEELFYVGVAHNLAHEALEAVR